VGAEIGVQVDEAWVHLRCLRDPELARLRRWLKNLRACSVAVEAEGMWLARASSNTPQEAQAMGRQWAQRRADLEALLLDKLGEFVGN
jgi:hypothetical protein